MDSRTVQKIIFFMAVVFIYSACSSSSSGIRYDAPRKKHNDRPDKRVRFTSVEDEVEFKPVEDKVVDKDEFIKRNLSYKNISKESSSTREGILYEVIKYLNTPYQYGGNSKNGIDCSAFTQVVYKNADGTILPRTARDQYKKGNEVGRIVNLKFGDLVFFDTSRIHYPGHVGIYLGDDLFAHASLSRGVTISSIESTYYKTRFVGAKRLSSN